MISKMTWYKMKGTWQKISLEKITRKRIICKRYAQVRWFIYLAHSSRWNFKRNNHFSCNMCWHWVFWSKLVVAAKTFNLRDLVGDILALFSTLIIMMHIRVVLLTYRHLKTMNLSWSLFKSFSRWLLVFCYSRISIIILTGVSCVYVIMP